MLCSQAGQGQVVQVIKSKTTIDIESRWSSAFQVLARPGAFGRRLRSIQIIICALPLVPTLSL